RLLIFSPDSQTTVGRFVLKPNSSAIDNPTRWSDAESHVSPQWGGSSLQLQPPQRDSHVRGFLSSAPKADSYITLSCDALTLWYRRTASQSDPWGNTSTRWTQVHHPHRQHTHSNNRGL